MGSILAKSKAATERVIESNAFVALSSGVMAGTVALLVGQYLTNRYYGEGGAPWPVDHFFVTALIVAGIAALCGWCFGKLFPGSQH